MTLDREKAQRDLDQWMEQDPRKQLTVIEAGIILTEHMQAALDEIARLRLLEGQQSEYIRKCNEMMHDDLAKIEAQAKRIAELENPDNVLYRLEKRLGEINADPLLVEAGKRIAELESLNEDLMRNGNDLRSRAQEAEKRVAELEGEQG